MNIDNIDKEYKKIESDGYNTCGSLYIVGNLIYKLFDDQTNCYTENREKLINYLLKKKTIYNSSYPLFKLYKNKSLIGYAMNYYKNTETFKILINKNICLKKKLKLISDTCNQLKQYHNYDVTLGDIHLDNMIGNDDGHLIDVDNSLIPGMIDMYNQCYTIQRNNNEPFTYIKSKNIDCIKSMICYLSLIYKNNFEQKRLNLQNLLELLNKYLSKNSIDFFREAFYNSKSKLYFDDILSEFNDEEKINNDSNEIKRKLMI